MLKVGQPGLARQLGVVLGSLLLSCAGCSGDQGVHVSGSVTNEDGTPLPRVRVIFRNSADPSLQARAVTNTDGHYELSRGEGVHTVPVGKYDVLLAPVVILTEGSLAPNIPTWYSTFRTSGLQVEVTLENATHDFSVVSRKRRR